MLTKILVTLLVIAGALFYIRKPARAVRAEKTADVGKQILFKYVVYGLIAFSLLASSGYWYWNWQDGNQIVDVTIVSPNIATSEVYQVRKKDIGNNMLTTVDGISIRLSNQERVVIAKNKKQ
ncbi:hypothetical protein [uncultured Shewanella sp.]|uniref:hypothetical protein n=1 Tax=uncultured Shewanella sp. TaxID=173975 RepID=UPI00261D8231|nr:hypothetical protein [uncultured Shewanella sp.]